MTTSVTPVVLSPGVQLGTGASSTIIGAVNGQTIIKRAVFTNAGNSGAVTITAYRVASGGSPSGSNCIIPGRSVAQNATDLAPELANMVLNAGDQVFCSAGTAAIINFFASGFFAS